jgi:tyrosine-protein phosphatase SIW14
LQSAHAWQHRTGCVVGVVRKASGWKLQNILDEYRSYAAPKIRECDLDYLSGFQTSDLDGALTLVQSRALGAKSLRRSHSFYRTLVVTTVVMLIWILSSIKMANGSVEFNRSP